jgi:hypothetical protein
MVSYRQECAAIDRRRSAVDDWGALCGDDQKARHDANRSSGTTSADLTH